MTDMPRTPAEAFSVGSIVADELAARGWTREDLARRMGGDYAVKLLTLELLIELDDDLDLLLGEETAEDLERSLGPSATFWLRTDAVYREWLRRRQTR